MPPHRDLPSCKQDHGHDEKRPGIYPRCKKQGRKHHRIVPVKDPAGTAAFILQEPGLEGTEKKDADHVADRIRKAQQEHHPLIRKHCHVQGAYACIHHYPQQCYYHSRIIVLYLYLIPSGRDVISLKLLLTAMAFKLRRKESEYHLDHENNPDENKDQVFAPAFKISDRDDMSPAPLPDVPDQPCRKYQASVGKLIIMKDQYRCNWMLLQNHIHTIIGLFSLQGNHVLHLYNRHIHLFHIELHSDMILRPESFDKRHTVSTVFSLSQRISSIV